MVHLSQEVEIPTERVGPVRVQLSRKAGWRMPENTVSVARPGKWGNPFKKDAAIESGYANEETAQAFVVECFRDWNSPITRERWWMGPESDARRRPFVEDLGELRGKNLACWCRLDQPCHADVLLELANKPTDEDRGSAGTERSGVRQTNTDRQGDEG